MSRHSRFIAAILCVLFALTSLCTFAVFAEDIGGGGGADGGDPNGYSDQGGNEGGETPGGGSGDDSGSGSGSGDDSGSGSGSGSGDDSGSGSGSGSDSGSGSGSGGGYSGDDSGSGSGGYSGGGSSSGSSSGSSNYDDNDDDSDYSGGSSYYDSNGNEYNSPDEVYVGGNQTYTPPASTPSTTAALFDTSKDKVDEKTLTNSDWDTIKSKLTASNASEIKTGVVDFSDMQKSNVSSGNNGHWLLIIGIALTILSIAGFIYFIVSTSNRRKKAASVHTGSKPSASAAGAQNGGRYRESSDYDDHYDTGAKKKKPAKQAKSDKPKNGTRYK